MQDKDVRFHPTQKPVALIEQIINYYLPDKGIVADFFSGSGSIAVACHNCKCDFIAVEKDIEYFEKSVARLADAQRQLKLF